MSRSSRNLVASAFAFGILLWAALSLGCGEDSDNNEFEADDWNGAWTVAELFDSRGVAIPLKEIDEEDGIAVTFDMRYEFSSRAKTFQGLFRIRFEDIGNPQDAADATLTFSGSYRIEGSGYTFHGEKAEWAMDPELQEAGIEELLPIDLHSSSGTWTLRGGILTLTHSSGKIVLKR